MRLGPATKLESGRTIRFYLCDYCENDEEAVWRVTWADQARYGCGNHIPKEGLVTSDEESGKAPLLLITGLDLAYQIVEEEPTDD